MRAMIPALLLAAAAVLASPTGAAAQASKAYDFAPSTDGPTPQAARPYGATYIPGVGFRYIAPGGPRVYSYYRARGDRRAERCRHDWWFFGDRCRHWR